MMTSALESLIVLLLLATVSNLMYLLLDGRLIPASKIIGYTIPTAVLATALPTIFEKLFCCLAMVVIIIIAWLSFELLIIHLVLAWFFAEFDDTSTWYRIHFDRWPFNIFLIGHLWMMSERCIPRRRKTVRDQPFDLFVFMCIILLFIVVYK